MPRERNSNVLSDNFDIEQYETDGNDAYKLQYNDSKRTRMTEAIEEIKDVKSYAYDNFKLLKISQIMNMIILGFLFLLMILVSVTVNNTGGGGEPWTPTADCEDGWVGDEGWLVDGDSLNMGCLLFGDSKMAWQIAKQWCEISNNARLVEIYSKQQHEFLKAKLNNLDSTYTTHFWTGATDEATEGSVVWASSQKDLAVSDNVANGMEWFNYWNGYPGFQSSSTWSSYRNSWDYVALNKDQRYQAFFQENNQEYHPICQIPPYV